MSKKLLNKKVGIIIDARASLGISDGGGSVRLEGILKAVTGVTVELADAKIWLYSPGLPISSKEVYITEDRVVLMYVPEDE